MKINKTKTNKLLRKSTYKKIEKEILNFQNLKALHALNH